MVPNPYGLYDDDVRSRTLWALREGLIVGAILLFWVVVAVALTVVLLVFSVPFALFRFGTPGLPLAGLIWTIVGPLASLNAFLYVLVRAGTVIVDHYRSGGGLTFEPGPGSSGQPESDSDADRDGESENDPDETDDAAGTEDDPVDSGDDANGAEGDSD